MANRYVLNVLITKVKEGWCARCLEDDFVTQADTPQELYAEIQRTVLGHIVISRQFGERPFHGLKKAAREYWEQYERYHLRVRLVSDWSALAATLSTEIPAYELPELRVAEVT